VVDSSCPALLSSSSKSLDSFLTVISSTSNINLTLILASSLISVSFSSSSYECPGNFHKLLLSAFHTFNASSHATKSSCFAPCERRSSIRSTTVAAWIFATRQHCFSSWWSAGLGLSKPRDSKIPPRWAKRSWTCLIDWVMRRMTQMGQALLGERASHFADVGAVCSAGHAV
jgi:hypothetical protein